MNINTITIEGNLTRDPEQRTISSGTTVTKFSIAVNREYKGEKSVSFFNVETWGKTAETCGQYLKKGSHVVIVNGELRQDTWEDSSGKAMSSVKIVASTVKFLGKKSDERNVSAQEFAEAFGSAPSDEDIPF